MTNTKLQITLGYLFEVGFNIGMLTYVEQNQLKHHFNDLYRQDLEHLNLTEIVRKLANDQNIIDYQNRKIMEKWCLFFLQKSFLSGLNFLKEYLTAIGWNKRPLQLNILYYQCSFCNDNSLGTYSKDQTLAYQEILSQLGEKAQTIDLKKYSRKGEFLKADTLMLMRRGKQLRLLSIDYSIFAVKLLQDMVNLDNVENLRYLLQKEIKYLKSKSVFSQLGLDSQDFDQDFTTSLSRYYKAFITKDKETAKMIQAGSYAYSFSQWLQKIGIITEDSYLTYHIIGYSDRGISAMTLNENNVDLLKTCHYIYTHQPKDQEMAQTRQDVFKYIKRNAVKSFDNGKEFIDQLLNISPNSINLIIHQERIADFQNITEKLSPQLAQRLNLDPQLNLRDAHGKLIQDFLSSTSPEVYLFLTGNPGIGKTTAIANFLKTDTCINLP
jgi:flagellar biosynthesis GTPase FlhF